MDTGAILHNFDFKNTGRVYLILGGNRNIYFYSTFRVSFLSGAIKIEIRLTESSLERATKIRALNQVRLLLLCRS